MADFRDQVRAREVTRIVADFSMKSVGCFDHGLSELVSISLNYAMCCQRALQANVAAPLMEPHRMMEVVMTDADEALVAEKLACIYGDRLVGILKKAVEDLP